MSSLATVKRLHLGKLRFSSYRERAARRILKGLCRDCGAARGYEGTQTRCALCADRQAAKRRMKADTLPSQLTGNAAV